MPHRGAAVAQHRNARAQNKAVQERSAALQVMRGVKGNPMSVWCSARGGQKTTHYELGSR